MAPKPTRSIPDIAPDASAPLMPTARDKVALAGDTQTHMPSAQAAIAIAVTVPEWSRGFQLSNASGKLRWFRSAAMKSGKTTTARAATCVSGDVELAYMNVEKMAAPDAANE